MYQQYTALRPELAFLGGTQKFCFCGAFCGMFPTVTATP